MNTIQPLLALLFVLTPIGIAVSDLFRLKFARFEQEVFGWIMCGTVTLIPLIVWPYFLGGTFQVFELLVGAVWVLSLLRTFFLILKRNRRRETGHFILQRFLVIPILAIVAGGFFLVPRTVDGNVSPRQLIGPDAVGYANAVSGMLEDGSFEDLRKRAVLESGYSNDKYLFDQEVKAVYEIPNKSLSVKAEFIIGSLRVGFPGIVALITDLVGFENLLSALYATSILHLTIGGLLIFGFAQSQQRSTTAAVAIASLSMINISLLVGFHEGGVVQAFMFSATASFLCASLQDELSDRARFFLYVSAFVQAISSYVDLLIVLTAVSVVWWGVTKVRSEPHSTHRLKLALGGAIVAAVLLLPLTIRLPGFLFRRLADARQSGWNWEQWTGIDGVLGLVDPYFSKPNQVVSHSLLIVAGLVIAFTQRNRRLSFEKSVTATLTVALFIFAVAFYLYSRHIMNHSTYQWFKLIGTFLGPISIPIAATVVPWHTLRASKFYPTVLILMSVFTLMIVSTSFEYSRSYFANSTAIPFSLVQEISGPEARDAMERYQVYGSYGWSELALTPFWAGQFLNRNDAGIRPSALTGKPVGLFVRKSDCPEWTCLAGVPSANIVRVGNQFRIIDLEMDGADVRKKSEYQQWLQVNRALAELGAPYIGRDWVEFGPILYYGG